MKKATWLGVVALLFSAASTIVAPAASASPAPGWCNYNAYNTVGSLHSMYFRGSYACNSADAFTFYTDFNRQFLWPDGNVQDEGVNWFVAQKHLGFYEANDGFVGGYSPITACDQYRQAGIVAVRVRSSAHIVWDNGRDSGRVVSDWGGWLYCG